MGVKETINYHHDECNEGEIQGAMRHLEGQGKRP